MASESSSNILKEVNETAVRDVNDFSETLSPGEKKAEAEKKAEVVLDSLPKLKADASIPTDQDTNDSSVVHDAVASAQSKPVVSLPREQQKEKAGEGSEGTSRSKVTEGPGSFYDKKIGWNAFSTLPNPGDESALAELSSKVGLDSLISTYRSTVARSDESNQQHHDLLSQFLNEAYYGEWYHNAAVMLFTVVFTWLLTKLGGGLMACLVVGAFLSTYYQTSIRRLRRNIRDDIQRELAINRLETETETADWINHFLSKFWLIYEPVLSAQIIGIADSILVESTPSFLDSIRLTTFTLGTKAPRIESVKTLTKTEPNIVCMDWKFSFIPNDTLDLTERDKQSKVNPKIVLTIRVGKGMIGAGMPVLLEDLAFSGHLRLKFRMFNEFPHIKSVEASFLEQPHFDYSLKPVGGETFGFDINNIPGLESFVREQVHATLGPMMYAPNVYTLDVAGMMSGATDLNSANGVLIVKIHSATNLKDIDFFGTIDPYITLHLNNASNAELGRTKQIEDNRNPKFDETLFVLLNNVNETLVLEVMDKNTGRSDSSIGICTFDLKSLAESDNVVDGVSLPVLKKGKIYGEVKCDFHYFPANSPSKSEDGTIIPAEESNSGILRFTVHECKELGGKQKSGGISIPIIGGKGDLSPYAVMKVNGKEKMRTSPFKRSINPRWDKSLELFVTDKSELSLMVNVLDDANDDKLLGRWSAKLEEFEEDVFIKNQDWWMLKDGCGKIHLSMQWKPITMVGFGEGMSRGGYRPPIGVVRVHFACANDLKNVEAITGGKSDPYVRIMSGVQNRGQTEHVDDDLDPVWNQVLYVPVHSKREDLVFEVMDYNEGSKDKSLGITDLHLKDIMKEVKTEDGQVYYEATDMVDRVADLVSRDRKKGRGTIKYTASFYPTLALAQRDGNGSKKTLSNQKAAEDESGGSQFSEEPELVEKPREMPERDLHNELIQYKTLPNNSKVVDYSAYESGVLVVKVHSVTLTEPQRVVVELLLDSNYPQFSTIEQKGAYLDINETGTVFIKEMDFSKLLVRVRNAKDADKDEKICGRCTLDARNIIERLMKYAEDETISEPVIEEVPLLESNGGGKVCVSFNFIPVIRFKLDPAESLENQGNLTVHVVKANNLTAADRSGTSDPFIRFYLEDQRVYKTQTYKKTLNPVFKDETFTVPVVNRVYTPLVAKIYDWDQVGKDTLIGQCVIQFTGDLVETFQTTTREIDIDNGGTLTVRLTWRPELVARKRTNTSLFNATTRAFTSAPGSAIGAGSKVLGTGVSALGSGIRGIGKIGKKFSSLSDDSSVSMDRDMPVSGAPTVASVDNDSTESSPLPGKESTTQRQSSPKSAGDEVTIRVDLLGAKNLTAMDRGGTSDPYCRVRIGNKVVYKTRYLKKTLQPEWNETFNAKLSANGVLNLKIKDHNTLNDVDIGEHHFALENNLRSGQPFDGWLPLTPEGSGEVHMRVSIVDSDSISIASKTGGLFGRK
ncbi:C2 domain-containing protein [Mycotypha africana]|uniref:C2 domain-containing protein n=1 Tax=Mycotypha africana TaxID=64632 RepID=UPI002301BEE7|nr:C2 domain-containing protein [Mycotypha africana]KAI8968003.1 C2 domain-containing protein [Mycotypha africana]